MWTSLMWTVLTVVRVIEITTILILVIIINMMIIMITTVRIWIMSVITVLIITRTTRHAHSVCMCVSVCYDSVIWEKNNQSNKKSFCVRKGYREGSFL